MNVFKIEKMDREQLLQICKIMNIKASKKHTKAQLITKLLKPLGRKYKFWKRFVATSGVVYYLLSGGPGKRDGVCFLQGKDQAITSSVANQTGIPDCISENLKYLPAIGKYGNGIYFQQLPEGVTETYDVLDDGTVSFRRCDNDLLKGTCKETNVQINVPPTKAEIEEEKEKARKLREDRYDEFNRQLLYDWNLKS
jgi:hypothetical protein